MATIARFTLCFVRGGLNDSHAFVQKWSPTDGKEQPELTTTHRIIGVTMEEAGHADQVGVMSTGVMRDVAMKSDETWAGGETLWGWDQGVVSNVRATPPFPQVFVGTVLVARDRLVDVDVNVRVMPSVSDLSNVARDPFEDRDFLVFNGDSLVWEARPAHRVRTETTTLTNPPLRDDTILCDASGGAWTLTLPSATGCADARFTVKKIDATRNVLTIDGDGTELIEDAESQELRLPGESLTLQSDGTQWWVV